MPVVGTGRGVGVGVGVIVGAGVTVGVRVGVGVGVIVGVGVAVGVRVGVGCGVAVGARVGVGAGVGVFSVDNETCVAEDSTVAPTEASVANGSDVDIAEVAVVTSSGSCPVEVSEDDSKIESVTGVAPFCSLSESRRKSDKPDKN